MQLVVEAAGVADWLAIGVSAPQGGGGALAVGATGSGASGGRLEAPFGLDEWPVVAVHLVVESAGVA